MKNQKLIKRTFLATSVSSKPVHVLFSQDEKFKVKITMVNDGITTVSNYSENLKINDIDSYVAAKVAKKLPGQVDSIIRTLNGKRTKVPY